MSVDVPIGELSRLATIESSLSEQFQVQVQDVPSCWSFSAA
jgi:hypothetical protein